MWREGGLAPGKQGIDSVVNEAYSATIESYKVGVKTPPDPNRPELRKEVVKTQKLV